MSSRKQRGRDTERLVADYLRPRGWPYVEPIGAGRAGADLTGTPTLAVEVKARRGLDLTAWLKQATRQADTRLPVLVIRGDGQGPTTVHQWAAVLTLEHLTDLLREAGHGADNNPTPEKENN